MFRLRYPQNARHRQRRCRRPDQEPRYGRRRSRPGVKTPKARRRPRPRPGLGPRCLGPPPGSGRRGRRRHPAPRNKAGGHTAGQRASAAGALAGTQAEETSPSAPPCSSAPTAGIPPWRVGWVPRPAWPSAAPAWTAICPAWRRDLAHVVVGEGVAPGWFGWAIPLGGGYVRIGVGCDPTAQRSRPADLLPGLFKALNLNFETFAVENRVGGFIPIHGNGHESNGHPHPLHADNVMLVGDAARQAKPTSGGGIYPGLVAAAHASAAAVGAHGRGDFSAGRLSAYANAWRRELGAEFDREADMRRLFPSPRRLRPEKGRVPVAHSRHPAAYPTLRRHRLSVAAVLQVRQAAARLPGSRASGTHGPRPLGCPSRPGQRHRPRPPPPTHRADRPGNGQWLRKPRSGGTSQRPCRATPWLAALREPPPRRRPACVPPGLSGRCTFQDRPWLAATRSWRG